MSEYDKKRAKNIAERDAIFSKIFKEFITDNKSEKPSRVLKKHETSSSHENSNDNDDDEEEGNELSENPPKKRKYTKSKIVEKREYNLRARSVPADTLSEFDVSDKDSTSKRRRNHHNAYKTRSWYQQNQTHKDNDRMMTRSDEKKNESMEEESIGAEEMGSDILQTRVSPVETMDKCIIDATSANSDEISMEKS